jgi:hypothetical protein
MSPAGIYEDIDKCEQPQSRKGTVYERAGGSTGRYELAGADGHTASLYDLASKAATYDLATKGSGAIYDLASKGSGAIYDLASKEGPVIYNLGDGSVRNKDMALYDVRNSTTTEAGEAVYDLGDGVARDESSF